MNRKRSVLVVDDDAAMRLAMARVLERAGYEVLRCSSGAVALEALEARPWQVMVSDIRMPQISGRELLSRSLQLRPELKVVMVTAYGTVADAVEAIRCGARDYLLKPFAPQTLLESVERCFESSGLKRASSSAGELIGQAPAFLEVVEQARRAARSRTTVMITGESGTGKEVLARYVHQRSSRADGPFVAVNCAALPPDLLEAELFGVRRGAFTGADSDREGHFQRADGGTLLLDEIGDFPLGLQAKLLRALEERVIVPLGAGEAREVDLRVIASTHQDLRQAVQEGRFRRDLYFRLCVIPLHVPPLRERPGDVVLLARHLAADLARRSGRPAPRFTREALDRLRRHPWPGNVRELRNVIERAVVLDRSGEIGEESLLLDDWASAGRDDRLAPGMTIAEAERRLIEATLDAAGGNRTRASEMLGISVRTLRNKLKIFRQEDVAAPSSSL